MIKKIFVTFFFLTIILSCNLFEIDPKQKNMNNIPFAKKIKVTHKEHNYSREDNYFWLKNRDDKDVVEYLEKETVIIKNRLKIKKSLKKIYFLK